MNGVSVVICTHNGARLIEMTLEALSRQQFSGSAEIVLVDNNSTDSVCDVAERFWSALASPPFPLNCIKEQRPGQAFARRAGVRAARYDVVIFCDDDNLLAPDYLARASEALAGPGVGAAGGACTPLSDRELPPFFYTHALNYAVGSPEIEPGVVNERRGWLFGAGLAVRRQDLLAIYDSPEFPTLSGRIGSVPSTSGDDVELCFSLRLLGYRLVYDDRLTFRHFIEARKLEKDYLKRLREGNTDLQESLTPYNALLDLRRRKTLAAALGKARRLALGVLRGKRDRFAEFWLVAFVGATPLMTQHQKRIFAHYLALLRSKRALSAPAT